MIYLNLFLSFLKIGVVSFGGGYGMLSLIRETAVNAGWLTESELLNFIAVSESTPGPIAINMATFIGSAQGGILGAAAATLGVVLPSFAIILLIVSCANRIMQTSGVQAALSGVRPCVVALILGTALTMGLEVFLGAKVVGQPMAVDFRALLILAMVAATDFGYRKWKKKRPSAILLILVSAFLGVLICGLLW